MSQLFPAVDVAAFSLRSGARSYGWHFPERVACVKWLCRDFFCGAATSLNMGSTALTSISAALRETSDFEGGLQKWTVARKMTAQDRV